MKTTLEKSKRVLKKHLGSDLKIVFGKIQPDPLCFANYLAFSGGKNYEIQIWIEKFLSRNSYDIWIGFSFINHERFRIAVKKASNILAVHNSHRYRKTKNNDTALFKDDFGEYQEYYLGFYKQIGKNKPRIDEIEAMITTVKERLIYFSKLFDNELAYMVEKNYSTEEKRMSSKHSRSRRLITLLKRESNGKCSICKSDTFKTYGANIIEIHHKKMRFSDTPPKTRISESDLVAICPNCHSSIHKISKKGLLIQPEAYKKEHFPNR